MDLLFTTTSRLLGFSVLFLLFDQHTYMGDLYLLLLVQTLIEGAITDYSDEGMQIAQDALVSAYNLSCCTEKKIYMKMS